jgi:MFS family permease
VEARGTGRDAETIAKHLRERSESLLQGNASERLALPTRPRAQAMGSVAMDLLLMLTWVLLSYVLFRSLSSVLGEWRAVGDYAVAATVALGITLISATMGYVLKEATVGATYASPATSAIAGRTGRRLLTVCAVLVLALAAALSAWTAVQTQALSDIGWVNGLYGVAMVAAIAVLAFNLDAGLVAFLRSVHVAGLGFGAAVVIAYALLSLIFEAMLYLVKQALRLAAVPGEWLRTLRSPVGVSHEANA